MTKWVLLFWVCAAGMVAAAIWVTICLFTTITTTDLILQIALFYGCLAGLVYCKKRQLKADERGLKHV